MESKAVFFLVAHMNQDDFPFEDVEPLWRFKVEDLKVVIFRLGWLD